MTGRADAAGSMGKVSRLRLLDLERRRVQGQLLRRFWLRWHMMLILATTLSAGVVANRLLLLLPVHGMALRWLIVLVLSYAAFFACVRIWLAYVGARPIFDSGDWSGVLDANPGSGSSAGSWHGGGGTFGGGGATGDFGSADSPSVEVPLVGRSDGGSGGGGSWMPDVDLGDGWEIVVLGILVVALIATIAGSAVYLILIAPGMLADTAFGAMLAGGLVHKVRRMDEFDWEGSVLKFTWKPFAAVAVFALVAGLFAQHLAPGARTLSEILMLYR